MNYDKYEYPPANMASAGEVPAMRIVDMRGPEVKVASSFAELAANLSGEIREAPRNFWAWRIKHI